MPMTQHRVSDINLVSDLSQPRGPPSLFSYNALAHHDSLSQNDESSGVRSPIDSEYSNSVSAKQVRFSEAVTITSSANHPKVSIQNTGQGDHDETEDITTVTPVHGFTSQSEDGISKVYLSRDCCDAQSLAEDDDSNVHSATKESPSGNTSLWLETSSVVEQRVRSSATFKDSPSLDTDVDAGVSFFRTTDHLPRPPPHYNSSNSRYTPFSSTNPSTVQLSDPDLPVPRPPRTSSPSWKSLSLSSLATDTVTEATVDDVEDDLSKPKPNTTHILVDQIRKLTQKLSCQYLSNHNGGTPLAENIDVYSNMHNQLDLYTPNPSLTVNIPEHVSTYTNLMDLSVDESEIVREERERIAQQRLRMARIRKEEAKKRSVSVS
ncbi:hypothetical protein FBUS_04991 [Fasciolopsis buskii]|uniref:Uncharacterized protein n=1 Tax=Fasciolopsis buskii TaxID=27845 RepID=A0A8E0VMN4_9TREM|nr:hypothetical protein FBUS_04991 [Fasciolopsis buski]